jgi:hypothetical protein
MSDIPAAATGDPRARITALLAAERDRGALLRALETLAREPEFADCADLWAPALYERDAYFFETFLLRHLHDDHAATIRALLARAEADGNDTLFAGLYRKVTEEEDWNAELLALARSPSPDDAVAAAVRRRDMSRLSYSLSEETALALYRRGPAQFRDFVREHVHEDGDSEDNFAQLRAEVRRQGDDDLFWALFRALADTDDWEKALGELLHQDVPAGAIVAELRKREIDSTWGLDASVLARFVDKYGAAVLPYIEEHLDWIDKDSGARLLPAVQRLGDEALYWRVFFRAGDSKEWNKALRDLLAQPLTDEALARALDRRTPPTEGRGAWHVAADVALALYERHAAVARLFLERTIDEPQPALFAAAERAGDEEFLDFLTARLLRQTSWLVMRVFLTPSQLRWQKPDAKAREELERLSQPVTARLDRLYAQAPADYAHHAAAILSRFEPGEIWSFGRNADHNPVFAYLFKQHRAAWRSAPDAIRELLESPNSYVQLIALEILADAAPDDQDAAQRVIENLPLLRAVLLSREGRNMKKRALTCLERAGRRSPAFAAQILPALEDMLYFRGKRAIDERIMVSYVRLRRFWAAQPAAQAGAQQTA